MLDLIKLARQMQGISQYLSLEAAAQDRVAAGHSPGGLSQRQQQR